MKQNYQTAIDFVFKYEGGYVNNPKDPGGPTNRGITLKTAQAFWKKNATAEDVKNMPKSVAETIYRQQYADKINFNTLPHGLDLCALDAAVMSGPARATRWLTNAKTIDEYQTNRLNFYKSLKIWPTFGKGWTARIVAGTKVAKGLPLDASQKPADALKPTPSTQVPDSKQNVPVKPTERMGWAAGLFAGIAATAAYMKDWITDHQILMIGVVGVLAIGTFVVYEYNKRKNLPPAVALASLGKKTRKVKKK